MDPERLRFDFTAKKGMTTKQARALSAASVVQGEPRFTETSFPYLIVEYNISRLL